MQDNPTILYKPNGYSVRIYSDGSAFFKDKDNYGLGFWQYPNAEAAISINLKNGYDYSQL